MAFSLSSSFAATKISLFQSCPQRNRLLLLTRCDSNGESSAAAAAGNQGTKKGGKLEIGSPIIVTEAPPILKTAASIPCLRPNSGLVKPGDVGRIMSRKPKDVWAVRLNIGTYLIDQKYFQPLQLDDD